MPVVYSKLGYNPMVEHQAEASVSQANPVSTTAYTVLATTLNVRVKSMWCRTGATTAGTTSQLNCVATVDGQTYTFRLNNPVANTSYYGSWGGSSDVKSLEATDRSNTRSFLIEGRSVAITIAVTWTVQPDPLECKIYYGYFP